MFKQFTIILCVMVLSNFNAKAQFTISEDTLHHEGFAGSDVNDYIDIASYTKITNTKSIADTIVWNRTVNILQNDTFWSSAVCDINLCHGTGVSSEKFVVAPNSTGDLSFHFYPKNVCGKGKMVVRFSRFSNPADFIDVVVTAKAWCLVDVKSITKSKPLVFPNPNNGSFTLQSDVISKGSLNILNTQGKIVSTINYTSGEIVNTNYLAKGIYMLNYSDGINIANSTLVVE